MTLGSPRPAVGVAFSYCASIAGFEVEYLGAVGEASSARHTAGGVFVNAIVQMSQPRSRLQFYGIGGVGLYGETMGNGRGSGEVAAKDVGGGVKIGLSDQVRLRIDYRMLFIGNAPDAASGFKIQKHPQRVAAGFSVMF